MGFSDKFCKINSNVFLHQAIDILENTSIGYAIVVSGEDIPVGVLFLLDALKTAKEHEPSDEVPVSDVMRRDFQTVSQGTEFAGLFFDSIRNIENLKFPLIIVDEEGKVAGIYTERNMIDMMYHNLQSVNSILDDLDDGIITVDENNKITYMNPQWKKIHDVEDNRLIGSNISESFPESELTKDEMLTKLGHPLHLGYTGATVLPTYKEITSYDNQHIGAVAIVRDYSEVNDFYIGINQMGNSNVLLSLVFNHMADGVFYVGKDIRIRYANKVFSDLFDAASGDECPENAIKKIIEMKFRAAHVETFTSEFEQEVHGEKRFFNVTGIPTIDLDLNIDGIVIILHDITGVKRLNSELNIRGKMLEYYKKQASKVPSDMVVESAAYQTVISTALKVAETDATVLITGENGVGKELVANLIHNNSSRKDKPLIPVNCGAIPETLWESEMFGYEEGSFTGGKKGGKLGVFEMADGGTVFLDEIGETSLATQVKLLRFLQNMEIEKIGRNDVQKVDVRIIAATNSDLNKMVESGDFRIDLYYRLNVIELKVPPLRDRVGEIKPMIDKFMSEFNSHYHKNVSISEEVVEVLKKQSWPGNVRQLRNVIEQAVIMCDDEIHVSDLPVEHTPAADGEGIRWNVDALADAWDLPAHVSKLEQKMISEALKEAGNNRSRAIDMLKISRKTFYKKLKEYDLK